MTALTRRQAPTRRRQESRNSPWLSTASRAAKRSSIQNWSICSSRPKARSHLDELTARERELLALLAEGLTDRGIGERLWLTPKTVETRVRHVLSKLGLATDSLHNRRVLAVLTYLRDAGAAAREPQAPTA